MDLNVTAGVFMVLMVAISTAVLLCCCKAYVVCKRRQRNTRNSTNRRTLRSRLHEHLPIGKSYNDEPPCYDDILSGRIPSKIATSSTESDDVDSISNLDAKSGGDPIVVRWSCDTADTDSIAPPLYACVVIENENVQNELPPPSYYENKNFYKILKKTSGNSVGAYTTKRSNVSQKVFNAIDTVSIFLTGAKNTNKPENEDPEMEISCDGNVMETSTSSRVSSSPTSSGQSSQKK